MKRLRICRENPCFRGAVTDFGDSEENIRMTKAKDPVNLLQANPIVTHCIVFKMIEHQRHFRLRSQF